MRCCKCQGHRGGTKQWIAETTRGVRWKLFAVVIAAGFKCSGPDWGVVRGGCRCRRWVHAEFPCVRGHGFGVVSTQFSVRCETADRHKYRAVSDGKFSWADLCFAWISKAVEMGGQCSFSVAWCGQTGSARGLKDRSICDRMGNDKVKKSSNCEVQWRPKCEELDVMTGVQKQSVCPWRRRQAGLERWSGVSMKAGAARR